MMASEVHSNNRSAGARAFLRAWDVLSLVEGSPPGQSVGCRYAGSSPIYTGADTLNRRPLASSGMADMGLTPRQPTLASVLAGVEVAITGGTASVVAGSPSPSQLPAGAASTPAISFSESSVSYGDDFCFWRELESRRRLRAGLGEAVGPQLQPASANLPTGNQTHEIQQMLGELNILHQELEPEPKLEPEPEPERTSLLLRVPSPDAEDLVRIVQALRPQEDICAVEVPDVMKTARPSSPSLMPVQQQTLDVSKSCKEVPELLNTVKSSGTVSSPTILSELEPESEPQPQPELEPVLSALQIELQCLSGKELRKRAEAEGVDMDRLADVLDADNPKMETVALIIAQLSSNSQSSPVLPAASQDPAGREQTMHKELEIDSAAFIVEQEQEESLPVKLCYKELAHCRMQLEAAVSTSSCGAEVKFRGKL